MSRSRPFSSCTTRPVAQHLHPWFVLDGAAALLDALAARPHIRALLTGHPRGV